MACLHWPMRFVVLQSTAKEKNKTKQNACHICCTFIILIVDPKRYVQCLYQNKAVEHRYISIGVLVSNLGVPLVLQICLYCQVSHVDFNFEISH